MQDIGQLATRVHILTPEDSLSRAAEAVRSSAMGAAPVIRDGRLAGLVTAGLLAGWAGQNGKAGEGTVDELPLDPAAALPDSLSAEDAAAFLRSNHLDCAPVVDTSTNTLVGMVSLAELVAAIYGRVRPPVIGGMATPLGVYLTGGGVRGGVGDLALMTTGIFMGCLALAAAWLTDEAFRQGGWIEQIPALARAVGPLSPEGVQLAGFLTFALLFRLTWVTGYHAAEHQVVHTIEAGDDLRPEVVRAKPRVHPRCGTNIVAAIGIMAVFWNKPWLSQLQPLLAMLTTFILWRRVGGWCQQYVTTRPASDRQIASGITAAEQLLERYRTRERCRTRREERRGPLLRIWNMGLLQVLGGFALVFGALWLAQIAGLPLPQSLLQSSV